MQKTISFVLTGVLAFGLLTGFGKAEIAPAVLTKEQEQLLQTAENGRESSVLLPDLEVPNRFSGDWSGVEGFINVHADAVIELPDTERIPVGTIGRRDFTQEDADNLMRVFLKGSQLYEELGMTKPQALDRLEQYEAMQRGEIPTEGDSVTSENLPDVIERWKEYVMSAPEESERKPASIGFESKPYDEELRGWAEVDGRKLHLFIQNENSFWNHACVFETGYGEINGTLAQPISLIPDNVLPGPLTADFPADEALSQGDALMAELGFQNVICDEITPVFFTPGNNPYAVTADESKSAAASDLAEQILAAGYELHYVRCLNGFPIGYTTVTGTATPETGSHMRAWMYEYITLDITEDGIKCFQWFSPHTEPVMLAEDSRLLPFDQIAEIFARMMMVKNNDVLYVNARNGFTTTRSFRINKVSLTVMRIRDRENFDEGLLIPVWDFSGTVQYEYDGWDNYGFTGDNEERIFLTVNAVDGSIIDRDLGY